MMAAKVRRQPFVPPSIPERAGSRPDVALLTALVEDIHRQLGHDAARPPTLLTEIEAAEVIQQKPRTLRAWRYARSKRLPFSKIGAAVFYRAGDLAAFILHSQGVTP
ncbi:MAG: helix-turn-helix domain-containing protein [bacterium]|nr:helix-turn-helix domain-containing protein [bacterium]